MPDTSKLEKLNRELEKSEKKLRKAINDEKALRSPKASCRRAVICASNEPNEYACIFTRRMPQQPTECWLPQSWSAPNQTGDATPSPLRFGRCRANVHWTFCTPALDAASYPFVDLPSGDTLLCKLVTVHSYLVPVTDFADASHSRSAKSATTTVSYGIFSSENACL